MNKYDPIAEVETDKVNAEVPSSFTGTIKEIVAKEGETIEVGELICYMEIESAGEDSATEEKNEKTEENNESNAVEENKDQSMKKRYSPAVMRMAQENDIDLNLVDGSGKGGRITRKDIEKIIASGDIPKPSAQEETPAQQVADETKTKSAKSNLNPLLCQRKMEILRFLSQVSEKQLHKIWLHPQQKFHMLG